MSGDLLTGEPQALRKRGISEETCAKWKYWVGKDDKGKTVQIANHIKDGQLIAQKVRTADKKFYIVGDGKHMPLYGQWLWRDNGKMLTITEGEIDALTVSQLFGNKWPVVSVPKGAAGAAKSIKENIQWVEQFESVIFMFDMDEVGQEAAKECARLLTPGKAKIATLPLKDANAMLVEGRGREVVDAVWGAKEFRPDGIVTMAELAAGMKKPIEWGWPWPWDFLTNATYGRRLGEVYMLGAGTGVGKTDVFTQIIAQTRYGLGLPVGVFYFEQGTEETGLRIAGKVAGKRFHIPDAGWTDEERNATVDHMVEDGGVYLYDSWGATEWEVVESTINYLAQAHDVQHFFVDHLTALAAGQEDERKALEDLMARVAKLAKRLNVCVYMVSHLTTPEGKPHEEGGRVMIRHFKGSRAIGFWSHFMFGLERDQQAEDLVKRQTTTFRILKDRYTGTATGKTFFLGYDEDSGMLSELADNPFDDEPGDDDSSSPF